MSEEISKKVTKEIDNAELSATKEINSIKTEEIPLVLVNYDVKNKEEEEAFTTFQKKYIRKTNILKTVAFGVLALLFVYQVAKTPSNTISWLCLAVCLAVIAIVWYNPYKIKKNLILSLKPLEQDRYIFKLFDDRITIETVQEENEKYVAESEIVEETDEEMEEEKIPPRVISFADINLVVLEKKDMFLFFLKRETIYVLPKRCMNEYDEVRLRTKLKEILGDDFETENK